MFSDYRYTPVLLIILLLAGLAYPAMPSVNPYLPNLANNTMPAITASNSPLPSVNHNLTIPSVMTIGPLAYVVGDIKTYINNNTAVLTDSGIYVIDTNSYDYNSILLANGMDVESIGLSPDGSVLYAAASNSQMVSDESGTYESKSNFLYRINTKNGEIIDKYDNGKFKMVRDVSVAPDGKVYVSWETNAGAQSGEDVFDFKTHSRWDWNWKDYFAFNGVPLKVVFNDDGSVAYFGGLDESGWIYIFDWNANKIYKNYVVPAAQTKSMGATDDGKTICTVRWDDTWISCLLYGSDRAEWDTGYYPTDLLFGPDGHTLYVAGYDVDTYQPKLHVYSGIGISSIIIGWSGESVVPLSFNKGKATGRMAITPDWKYAYVVPESDYGEGVAVVDLATMNQVATVDVPVDRFGNIVIASEQTLWNSSKGKFSIANLLPFTVNPNIVLMPSVIYSSPTGKSTSLNGVVSAKFSTDMDPTTIDTDSFTLLNPHNYKVPGSVSFSNGVATFTSTSKLLANATYTAKLSSFIKDKKGNPLTEYSWKFITGTGVISIIDINSLAVKNGTGMSIYLNTSGNGNQTAPPGQGNNSAQLPVIIPPQLPIIPPNLPPSIPNVPGNQTQPGAGNATICTMDAKQCPDGSYVSRVGPDCEFAPCPQAGGNGTNAGSVNGTNTNPANGTNASSGANAGTGNEGQTNTTPSQGTSGGQPSQPGSQTSSAQGVSTVLIVGIAAIVVIIGIAYAYLRSVKKQPKAP